MAAEVQLYNSNMITPAGAVLSAAVLQDYILFIDRGQKTTQTYITNLRQFVAWTRYMQIVQPVRADIISYRDYLITEHKAIVLDNTAAEGWSFRTDKAGNTITVSCRPNTVAQYLRSVCQFFRWAAANNLYPNIADNIHAPKVNSADHKKEALTAEDVLQIEQSITAASKEKVAAAGSSLKDQAGRIERATEQGKRTYAMYLLAVNAGLRTIELERANVKDIEVKGGKACIYVWGKGHSEADTKKPLAPEVYQAIKDYLNIRSDKPTGSSPLFVSTGNRSGGKRIAARTISGMLKKAMQQAGYDSERITAHSLRHTAGTNAMQLSGNLYAVQKYMRHSSPATTEIYLHNDTEKQDAAIAEQLYKHYHGTAGAADQKARLQLMLETMTAEQLQQLAGIAAAMVR